MQTATPRHLVGPKIICCPLLSCSEKEDTCSRFHALTELDIKPPFHRITEWLRLEAHLEATWSSHPVFLMRTSLLFTFHKNTMEFTNGKAKGYWADTVRRIVDVTLCTVIHLYVHICSSHVADTGNIW